MQENKTCESCKNWAQASVNDIYSLCDKIEKDLDIDVDCDNDDPYTNHLCNGFQSVTAIRTHKDFGCIKHENK